MCHTIYPISILFEYLPVRYNASYSEQQDRKEVYRFKDGDYSRRVLNGLESEIRSIVGYNPSSWVVAFIPASTSSRTRCKYQTLAKELARDLNVVVSLDAIYNVYDRESTMSTGKVSDPTAPFGFRSSEFDGKKVILIDDVITTGRSFNRCAEKLVANGARTVHGLFVAKTVNPDWVN